MKRFLLIIVILDLTLAFYLSHLSKEKKAYPLREYSYNYLIQKKELKDIDIDSFKLGDYFEMITSSDFFISHEFIDDILKIRIFNNKNEEMEYSYKVEYEIEEIKEKIIIKEVYVDTKKDESKPTLEQENNINEAYFTGYHDIEIAKDSSIEELVYLLSKDIKTNQNVTIHYAEVNLSKAGDYKASYFVEGNTYSIIVRVKD